MIDSMEYLEQPLYDTEDLGRIGQIINLFVNPVGSSVNSAWRESRNKDWNETNLVQCGMLESPHEFTVRDIQVLLYDKDGPLPVFDRTGMGNLWAKAYLEFSIGMRIRWRGPLSLVADPVCQMGGLQSLLELRERDAVRVLELLNYQREHSLESCHIRCQENFCVRVMPMTPVCKQVSVRVVLNGKRKVCIF